MRARFESSNFCRGILAAACLTMSACSAGDEAQEVAEAFCHRYFVEMNQAHALEIANGLAAEKLRKEIALLKGSARAFEGGEREFHQLKPFMDYTLQNRDPLKDEGAEKVLFIYEIRAEARQDAATMKSELVLNLVRENGRWLVNNYDLASR